MNDVEKQRLLEQYAISNLQESLVENKEELALITLTIEEERKKALETLKLLAASREAQRILKEQAGGMSGFRPTIDSGVRIYTLPI